MIEKCIRRRQYEATQTERGSVIVKDLKRLDDGIIYHAAPGDELSYEQLADLLTRVIREHKGVSA